MEHDSSEAIDPLIGRTFGSKYTLVEKLGSGGMGGVYKAEQALMNRFVAIKILRSTFHGDETQMRRFQQEARTLSQLSHPNAVTVFDFGVEEGFPYLVMEYIEGKTLKSIVREEKRLPLDRIKGILRQSSAALSEAHRLGIVHRDIKPDNIMLRTHHDGSDWVKVLDFGVAKSVIGNDPNLTQAGVLVGTPQYMSPEQCRGKELDARADIFSLGVVLYEMLTGEVPFQAPSVLELLMKVMNSEAESIRKFKPMLTIPPAIDAVVLRSLAKDPEERYQTIADFYSSFESALPRVPGGQGGEPAGPLSKKAILIILISAILVAAVLYPVMNKLAERNQSARQAAAEKRAVDAAKLAEAEKKKAEEEAARFRADAAIKDAQAWQAEQERLKFEEEQKKEREQLEALRKEESEKTLAMQKELEAIKRRQVEMEAKVKEAEQQQQRQVAERLERERREVEQEGARKTRELEQKVDQVRQAKEEAERAVQNRAREAARVEASREAARREEARREEARREQARREAEAKVIPATPAPTPPRQIEKGGEDEDVVKKKPRRRCGPTWCD